MTRIIKQFLRSFYHACWYVLAAVVLSVAVCVTLLRLSLPYIDSHREDVQVWVGDFIGYPVEIKHIDAEWQGWIPHLSFNEISIFNPSHTGIIANFQSAQISFDPLSSLRQRELTPLQLTITGLDLTIVRQQDGSISIARAKSETAAKGQDDTSTEFSVWLLLQKNISIRKANVIFHDLEKQSHPVLLSDVSLKLRNASGRTQLEGSATLPVEYGEGFSFALDAYGNITTPLWSGQLYLEGRNIYPVAWLNLNENRFYGIKLNSAPGTVKLWSDWQDAKINKLEGQLDIPDIQLQSDDANHEIQHLASAFTMTRHGDSSMDLNIVIDKLQTENGIWPGTTINISKQPGDDQGSYRYISQFSYLKLDDVAPLAKSIPDFRNVFPDLDNFELYGNLTDGFIIYNPALQTPEQLFFGGDIHQLKINYGQNNSRVTGLSGYLQGTLGRGIMKINSTSVDLSLPSTFENPLAFNKLNGDINWTHDDMNWIFRTDHFEAHTADFNSQLKGEIIIQDSLPFTDMLINISNANIEKIPRYMPVTTPEEVRSWLDHSLVSGNVSSCNMVIRGWLNDFPYSNNEGQFKTVANVHNATVDYHPDWTPINAMEAEVMIDKNTLVINANSGKILDANITHAQAVINNLFTDMPTVMRVDGEVQGHTKDAIIFINNNPLDTSGSLSEITRHEIDGQLTLTLGLDIPFDDAPVKVNGEIFFHDATLNYPGMGIKLNNIIGTVLFTDNSITSREISANYFNYPVELGINGAHGNIPNINIGGIADSRFIIEQIAHFFPELAPAITRLDQHITGSCNWLATLSPAESSAEANYNRILNITSSLTGLSIDLPGPIGKATDSIPLEISTIISEANQKVIDFEYGHILFGHIEFDNTVDNNLTQAVFTFGTGTNSHAHKQGITVDGQIDYLSIQEWFDFISTLNMNIDNKSFNKMRLDITASSLDFLDQVFSNVNIQLHKQQPDWIIDFNGEDIDGNIAVPTGTASGPLRASFNKINIVEDKTSDSKFNIDPGKLPPLQVQVSEFNYGEVKLGKMELNTSTIDNGMSIDSISFYKPKLDITGNGTWQLVDGNETSDFNIGLRAKNLNSMLETFDYNVAAIKGGETTMTLVARWDGSPMDFSLANIHGNLLMDIGEGQLLDINPTAGRLFGLLSIQTLARRLAMDFTDLFSEGLSFDQIEGNFTIEAGNAYTKDLNMSGPSADIEITGRTGLIAQDYDQLVIVTPQFADSLPVASALFGPIGLGVGAVIFLAGEMFESIPEQIDKLLRYQYTIKGKWDEPIVEKHNSILGISG